MAAQTRGRNGLGPRLSYHSQNASRRESGFLRQQWSPDLLDSRWQVDLDKRPSERSLQSTAKNNLAAKWTEPSTRTSQLESHLLRNLRQSKMEAESQLRRYHQARRARSWKQTSFALRHCEWRSLRLGSKWKSPLESPNWR